MILGLDISTSVVGICLLDIDAAVIKNSHIDLRKVTDFYEMLDLVEAELSTYPEPNAVFVEEPVMSFSKGKSSALSIATLQAFNGAVRYIAWNKWRKPVSLVSARSARSKLKIDTKLPKGLSAYHKKKQLKEKIISWCIEQDVDLGFEKTKQDNWQVWCGDRADAYVVARYGIYIDRRMD